MRAFVAIFLPERIRDHWLEARAREQDLKGVRWISPQSLHLTVAFLGDTSESRLVGIKSVLSVRAEETRSFSLQLNSSGAFPSETRPRVCWIGCSGEVDALMKLGDAVQTDLRGVGCEIEERLYQPHLTVGRASSARGFADKRFCTLFRAYQSPMFNVTDFHLVRSHPGPSGSRYESLARFPLVPAS